LTYRTANLQSCILNIYSTNIGTEYFKHGIYSPFFSLKNAVFFIILTCLVPVLFTFCIQGVLKLKKNNSGAKRLTLYPTLKLHDLRSDIPLDILTSDILVPVYGAYGNLVVSSVGLKRFDLLGSASSSRAGVSSLGCVMSSYRYLVLQVRYF